MSAFYRISPETVVVSDAATKDDILRAVAGLLSGDEDGPTSGELIESLQEREALGSTGFGNGIAMPHGRSDKVRRPRACLMRLEKPVDFDATDGVPVSLVLGLVSPVDAGVSHLHALAALSRMVRSEEVRDLLLSAPDADALYALMADVSERHAA